NDVATGQDPQRRRETRRFPEWGPSTRLSAHRVGGPAGTPTPPATVAHHADDGLTGPASTAPSPTAGDRDRPASSRSRRRPTRSPSPGRPSSPSPSAR